MTDVLHEDCVCCRAKADCLSSEQSLLVLMHMLTADNMLVEQVVRDLCFHHQSELDRAWLVCFRRAAQ